MAQFDPDNDRDATWRQSLSEKAQSIIGDLQATFDELRDDPSDALVAKAVKLESRQGEIAALERAHVVCGPALQERAVQRTREPLREALQAVVDTLSETRNAIAREHSETSARYGLDEAGEAEWRSGPIGRVFRNHVSRGPGLLAETRSQPGK